MNKAINMTLSCVQLVEILYGQPFVWGKGIGESGVDRTPGRIMIVGPNGEINVAAISSDVPNALTFSEDLRSDMDEQSHFPGVATGRMKDMPRGNLSGVAIELLFFPALKKTDGKRCRYGEMIIEVSKALLVLNHMSEDIDITLEWQQPIPKDDLTSWQSVPLMQAAGISNATIQRERGYDPEEQLELSQTEDAQKLLAFSRGQGMPPAAPTAPGMSQNPAMQQAMQQQQQPGQPPQSPIGGR